MQLKKFLIHFISYPEYIPSRFASIFAIFGIIGILIFDHILHFQSIKITPFTAGLIFTLSMAVFLYFLLRYMLHLLKNIEASYKAVEKREKESLRLFNFALDNSADATYWFTFDGQFYYANDAACRMLGYSKEEMLSLKLWDMDKNFSKEQAGMFLEEIKDVKYTTFETIQTRKDGSTIPIEVSANFFGHEGAEFICAFGRDISERREYQNAIEQANKELTDSIAEKEILLKEVHHRVKNNLEIISSLLSMQYRRITDKNMKVILQQSRSRIHTMSLVHEFLYKSEALNEIDLSAYVKQLVLDISFLHSDDEDEIKLNINIPMIRFSPDASIRIGIILHELCVNAIKYAFKNRTNNILDISLENKDGIIHLTVHDNGEGMQDLQKIYQSKSLGIQLIKTIVEDQLDGELDFTSNNGLECHISFPIEAVS
ncbi:MAG: PAS domain S-box-containing protein [Sulfurimonas sp.]|jgi:PAS domain S-box-containing protein